MIVSILFSFSDDLNQKQEERRKGFCTVVEPAGEFALVRGAHWAEPAGPGVRVPHRFEELAFLLGEGSDSVPN